MRKYGLYIALVAIVGVLVGIFLIGGGNSDNSSRQQATKANNNQDNLPGLLTGDAPWGRNTDKLKARLEAIGLPALPREAVDFHIHQHLDIYVNGKPVEVPPEIGINEQEGFISELHTHDTRGVIHVESPQKQDFFLGQFMDIWGVRFDRNQLGGYAASGDKKLRVYVNGQPFGGDPRQLKLEGRQEIAIVYGTDAEIPNPVPATFAFTRDE